MSDPGEPEDYFISVQIKKLRDTSVFYSISKHKMGPVFIAIIYKSCICYVSITN